MALWTFGCSFSVGQGPFPEETYHPSWGQILAGKMGLNEYRNYAEWGVSNEWIVDSFMRLNEEIKSGDTVIIQLTEKSRQWFFKDKPEIGNFYITDLDKYVTKDQQKAVEMYITHLDNDDIQNIRYALTCMAVKNIADTRKDCKLMILPGFNYVPGVKGSLLEICNGEFVSDESRLAWYNEHPVDTRLNHMSEANHHILAEKIFRVFNTGRMLDLTTGFDAGFL